MIFLLTYGALIILIGEANSAIIDNSKNNNEKYTKSVLLRKLLENQRPDTQDTKSVTWNEILASVLVKTVKEFPSNEIKSEAVTDGKYEEYNGNFFTSVLSNTLLFFKTHIYDKFVSFGNDMIGPEEWDGDPYGNPDPSRDVEVFEPRYHGKLCATCNSTEDLDDCPDGSYKVNGKCVASLLLAVPNQCPDGYRRDRLGFCRQRF